MRLKLLYENVQRNLLTDYDDTLLAMAEIEGEGWLDRQLRATESDQITVPNMLKHIRLRQQEIDEHEKDLEAETDPEEIESIKHYLDIFGDHRDFMINSIYGGGGWNRWFVRANGEVVLSRHHASSESIARAKELGFEVTH